MDLNACLHSLQSGDAVPQLVVVKEQVRHHKWVDHERVEVVHENVYSVEARSKAELAAQRSTLPDPDVLRTMLGHRPGRLS